MSANDSQTKLRWLSAEALHDDAQVVEHAQRLAVNYGQDQCVGHQQGKQEVDEMDDEVAWRDIERRRERGWWWLEVVGGGWRRWLKDAAALTPQCETNLPTRVSGDGGLETRNTFID